MNIDEEIELEEKFKFGEEINEKEYEEKFPEINRISSSGTTYREEEEVPNSENMQNRFELNDTNANNDNNNNNNNVIIQVIAGNDQATVTVIFEEREDFYDVYEEPHRDNITHLVLCLNNI